MTFRQKGGRKDASVDLIPMIDIVFQLILFFLVSTTFANLPGIDLTLPSSSTSEGTDAGGITITMEADGGLWFNSEPVTSEGLDAALASFDEVSAEERSEYPVSLEADELVTNGAIVGVFDILRRNGFQAVNLRTAD